MLTTMTTVGYGDKIPITIVGKFIACIAALFGITTISLYPNYYFNIDLQQYQE